MAATDRITMTMRVGPVQSDSVRGRRAAQAVACRRAAVVDDPSASTNVLPRAHAEATLLALVAVAGPKRPNSTAPIIVMGVSTARPWDERQWPAQMEAVHRQREALPSTGDQTRRPSMKRAVLGR
jgi:hypothetical protein